MHECVTASDSVSGFLLKITIFDEICSILKETYHSQPSPAWTGRWEERDQDLEIDLSPRVFGVERAAGT